MLSSRKYFARFTAIASAALAIFFALSVSPAEAEARHRWRRGWFGFGAGFHGWLHGPPIWFHFHRHAPPPPPPPPYGYDYRYGYGQPAPPPPPVAVQPAYRYPYDDAPRMGLAVAGLVEAPQTGQLPLGGVAAALQFRTSSHSMLSIELQSLGAHRLSDDARRSDVGGLLAGRVFLWNAPLAPYLELGGGLGRASFETSQFEVRAVQLLGRLGVGVELRLGRHIAIDGQIAQMHRLSFDEPVGTVVETHERATHFRGGLTLRF